MIGLELPKVSFGQKISIILGASSTPQSLDTKGGVADVQVVLSLIFFFFILWQTNVKQMVKISKIYLK